MSEKYKILEELYSDNATCAKRFWLEYCQKVDDWYKRVKKSSKKNSKDVKAEESYEKSFEYFDEHDKKIIDKKTLEYINSLAIPPNRKHTIINPEPKAHLLALGFDAKKRKQYMYHEDWSAARNLLNSYKLLIFGSHLPEIRKQVEKDLQKSELSFAYVRAVLVLTLDKTVIRIGNKTFYEDHKTVGLTTLEHKHVHLKQKNITLKFKGKSGKKHAITVKNKELQKHLKFLCKHNKKALFSYKDGKKKIAISPDEINEFLQSFGSELISAKDFRTWHGTRVAFNALIKQVEQREPDEIKRKKAILQAIDEAAAKLWNSRSMARNSYVHKEMIETFEEEKFLTLHEELRSTRKKQYLSKKETELLVFLERLYDENFEF